MRSWDWLKQEKVIRAQAPQMNFCLSLRYLNDSLRWTVAFVWSHLQPTLDRESPLISLFAFSLHLAWLCRWLISPPWRRPLQNLRRSLHVNGTTSSQKSSAEKLRRRKSSERWKTSSCCRAAEAQTRRWKREIKAWLLRDEMAYSDQFQVFYNYFVPSTRLRLMIATVMWAQSWKIVLQALKVRLMIVMMTRSQRREADPELAKIMWRVSLMQRYAGNYYPASFLHISFDWPIRVTSVVFFYRFIKAYKKFGSPLERWAQYDQFWWW